MDASEQIKKMIGITISIITDLSNLEESTQADLAGHLPFCIEEEKIKIVFFFDGEYLEIRYGITAPSKTDDETIMGRISKDDSKKFLSAIIVCKGINMALEQCNLGPGPLRLRSAFGQKN
ncbi:hypothetical protein C4569_02990 [Candidatus Parcubacteria bacterium]|nr:MAG: hypothetical protein C4569_02990 [Candidatus Parcubacteria bacterium]